MFCFNVSVHGVSADSGAASAYPHTLWLTTVKWLPLSTLTFLLLQQLSSQLERLISHSKLAKLDWVAEVQLGLLREALELREAAENLIANLISYLLSPLSELGPVVLLQSAAVPRACITALALFSFLICCVEIKYRLFPLQITASCDGFNVLHLCWLAT